MLDGLRKQYEQFPRTFWVVAGTHFIDVIGNTLLMPFFALYVTQKFNVGMTQAGIILATNSIAGMVGSTIGGAMADRFGRRGIILFGLVVSALSGLTLGFVNKFYLFYGLSVFVGLLGSAAYPAHQAMIADILPAEKRAEGFGMMRVISNFAWIIGPTIGGILAAYNFLYLFLSDAVISVTTAILVFRLLPETKPQPKEGGEAKHESLLQTLSGYRVALVDRPYLAFILASILMILVYQQMYSSLSVHTRCSSYGPRRLIWLYYVFKCNYRGLAPILCSKVIKEISSISDDDGAATFLYDWIYHVWICRDFQLYSLRPW
ncbi:MAG: MFS transporter [Anaerolineales bacterium]